MHAGGAVELLRRLAARDVARVVVGGDDARGDEHVEGRVPHGEAQPGRDRQVVRPVGRVGVGRAEEEVEVARRLLQRHHHLLAAARGLARLDDKVDLEGGEAGGGVAHVAAARQPRAEEHLCIHAMHMPYT